MKRETERTHVRRLARPLFTPRCPCFILLVGVVFFRPCGLAFPYKDRRFHRLWGFLPYIGMVFILCPRHVDFFFFFFKHL